MVTDIITTGGISEEAYPYCCIDETVRTSLAKRLWKRRTKWALKYQKQWILRQKPAGLLQVTAKIYYRQYGADAERQIDVSPL